MKNGKPKQIILTCLIGVVVIAAVICLGPWVDGKLYDRQQAQMVKRVMESDPQALLVAGRELLAKRNGRIGDADLTDIDLPPAIRGLRPTEISFRTNSVSIEFSDVFNPFGITVFDNANDAPDPYYRGHKWVDGLWLYHDGQLEGYAFNTPPKDSGE